MPIKFNIWIMFDCGDFDAGRIGAADIVSSSLSFVPSFYDNFFISIFSFRVTQWQKSAVSAG